MKNEKSKTGNGEWGLGSGIFIRCLCMMITRSDYKHKPCSLLPTPYSLLPLLLVTCYLLFVPCSLLFAQDVSGIDFNTPHILVPAVETAPEIGRRLR